MKSYLGHDIPPCGTKKKRKLKTPSSRVNSMIEEKILEDEDVSPLPPPLSLPCLTTASSSGQPSTSMASESSRSTSMTSVSSSSSVMTSEGQPNTGGRSCSIVTSGRQPDTLIRKSNALITGGRGEQSTGGRFCNTVSSSMMMMNGHQMNTDFSQYDPYQQYNYPSYWNTFEEELYDLKKELYTLNERVQNIEEKLAGPPNELISGEDSLIPGLGKLELTREQQLAISMVCANQSTGWRWHCREYY